MDKITLLKDFISRETDEAKLKELNGELIAEVQAKAKGGKSWMLQYFLLHGLMSRLNVVLFQCGPNSSFAFTLHIAD